MQHNLKILNIVAAEWQTLINVNYSYWGMGRGEGDELGKLLSCFNASAPSTKTEAIIYIVGLM